MSAAEKLKALVVEIDRHGGAEPNHKVAFYAHIRYLDALPQIVAVVKAAEICRSEWQMGSILAAALDALDEALGDVT